MEYDLFSSTALLVAALSAVVGGAVGFLLGFLAANWNAHKRWEEVEEEARRMLRGS